MVMPRSISLPTGSREQRTGSMSEPSFLSVAQWDRRESWCPGRATERCERDFLRLVSGVSNSNEIRGGAPEPEAKRSNEPRPTPPALQPFNFHDPLLIPLQTFC